MAFPDREAPGERLVINRCQYLLTHQQSCRARVDTELILNQFRKEGRESGYQQSLAGSSEIQHEERRIAQQLGQGPRQLADLRERLASRRDSARGTTRRTLVGLGHLLLRQFLRTWRKFIVCLFIGRKKTI